MMVNLNKTNRRGVFDRRDFKSVRGKWGRKRQVILLVVFLMEALSVGFFFYYRNWTNRRNSNNYQWVFAYTGRNYRSDFQAENNTTQNKDRQPSLVTEEIDEETLQRWLEERESPLAPYADEIIDAGARRGIHNLWKLVVAISGCESSLGKVCSFHNAWGIKCSRNNYCNYKDWEEGIIAINSLLASDIYSLGDEVTREDIKRIASTYARDPSWPNTVLYFWEELTF